MYVKSIPRLSGPFILYGTLYILYTRQHVGIVSSYEKLRKGVKTGGLGGMESLNKVLKGLRETVLLSPTDTTTADTLD